MLFTIQCATHTGQCAQFVQCVCTLQHSHAGWLLGGKAPFARQKGSSRAPRQHCHHSKPEQAEKAEQQHMAGKVTCMARLSSRADFAVEAMSTATPRAQAGRRHMTSARACSASQSGTSPCPVRCVRMTCGPQNLLHQRLQG
jgi:hypothetical protein